MSKICSHCGKRKPFRLFYKDKSKKDGCTSWCKACVKKGNYNRVADYGQMREYNLRRNYGINSEQYDQMVEAQNGVCAICELPEINRRLSVDHNHKTGRVRGLLCANCNARLGVVEDKKFNDRAKQYLGG